MVSRLLRRVGIVTVLVVAAVVPLSGANSTPGAGMSGMTGMAGMAGMGPAEAATVAVDEAPSAATVRIDRGAAFGGYSTPVITLAKGGTLNVINFDSTRHSVTSDGHDANSNPLFSVIVNPGSTVAVDGVSALAPGVYPFHCIFHPNMRGTLTISGSGGGVVPTPLSFDQPLVQPKRLTTSRIRIPVKQAAVRVMPTGPLTTMWTYGGTFPGPTIVRPAGTRHQGHVRQPACRRPAPSPSTCTATTSVDQDDGQPTRLPDQRTGKRRPTTTRSRDAGKPEPGGVPLLPRPPDGSDRPATTGSACRGCSWPPTSGRGSSACPRDATTSR